MSLVPSSHAGGALVPSKVTADVRLEQARWLAEAYDEGFGTRSRLWSPFVIFPSFAALTFANLMTMNPVVVAVGTLAAVVCSLLLLAAEICWKRRV